MNVTVIKERLISLLLNMDHQYSEDPDQLPVKISVCTVC